MKIPIKSKSNNQYLSIGGVKGHTFEMILPDVDHMHKEKREAYFDSILKGLINLSPKTVEGPSFLKIYSNSGKAFLNTNYEGLALDSITLNSEGSLEELLLGKGFSYTNIISGGDHYKVGSRYLRFFKVKSFPSEIADFNHFVSLCDYFICLKRVPKDSAIKLLDHKRKTLRSHNTDEFSDYQSEDAEFQAEELLSEVQLGSDGIFEVEFWFYLLTETEEELQRETHALLSDFQSSDAKIKIEDLGLTNAFLNFLPGVPPNFLDSSPIPISYSLGLIPLSRDFIHSKGLMLSSETGAPVYLDPFLGSNYNLAIIGSSGSGKTFLAQEIVDHYLSQGLKCFIIDRGHSFLSLARYHDANIFTGKINPFQFDDPSFLTSFFMSLVPSNAISYDKRCLFYKVIKKTKSFESISHFIEVIDQEIKGLSLYFEESLEYLTDEKVHLSNITFIDTRAYPDRILPALFLFTSEYVKGLEGEKCFVFEECWKNLSSEIEFLGEFFRTSRAKGVSCIAITQSLKDLLASEIGQVIAENTYFKFLFSAPKVENSHFDQHDIETMGSLKGREFFLKSEEHSKILEFMPTNLKYELFTTHPDERRSIDQFISQYSNHFDYQTLIHRWSELKYGKESIHNLYSTHAS